MLKSIAILILLANTLPAQTFEVASVRRSSHGETSGLTALDPQRPTAIGRVEYFHVTLRTMLMVAYGVGRDQVSGPPWLTSEYYDIIAKLPAGVLSDQVPAMLRNLLADRFQMTVHQEMRPRRGFALLADSGGAKLHASKSGGDAGFTPGFDRIQFTNTTMTAFAGVLSSTIGRSVTDQTGISGRYDITLNASRTDLKAAGSTGDRTSGLVAVAFRDLGLKLEPLTLPATNIVVDKAQKTPTAN